MMKIEQLVKKYDDFYVPAFAVRVNHQDLVRELFLTITSAEVDLQEKAAGRFTFTVANAFDWELRAFVSTHDDEQLNLIEFFAFGSEVEIAIGYGDDGKLPVLLRGIITEISTSFNAGGTPELTVSGFDKLHLLTVGKQSRNWQDRRDSDAARDLVQAIGLKTNITQTSPVKQRIDKGQETPLAFLQKLADRNDFIFFIQDEQFYFVPKKEDTEEADIELLWGGGLLSFSPEANLAAQIGSVEVRGVSAERGEVITGKAKAGEERGDSPRTTSGSEQVRQLPTDSSITIRASVRTQEEADRLAQAILEGQTSDYIKGNGESIGIPDIKLNRNIKLLGLGQPFSTVYCIRSAKHSISSSGYKTTWTAEKGKAPEPEGSRRGRR